MSRIDWHLSSKYLCSGLILPAQPGYRATDAADILQSRLWSVVNVELHCCFLFKTIAYVHPNLNPCSAAMRKSGSKVQHVTIGACALSARTYNAEVQGSDARLRNDFEYNKLLRSLMTDSHTLIIYREVFFTTFSC